jgi:hypothetical protein
MQAFIKRESKDSMTKDLRRRSLKEIRSSSII